MRKRENKKCRCEWKKKRKEKTPVGKEAWEEKADEKSRFSHEVWLPHANDTYVVLFYRVQRQN